MPFGFSILDYIMVGIVALTTLYSLGKAPHRLLVWLPTFLTIDFFIPLGTQLTPGRFVPLILGGWLVLSQQFKPRSGHLLPILVFVVTLIMSTCYSLNVADTGLRPIFRVLHYVGLIFLFVFMVRMLQSDEHIELAFWGIFLAGLIHGGHALYQLFASFTGLPFRGIVYSETSDVVAAFTSAGLRVNGFADEPKRLGYVLFSAAMIATYFAFRRNIPFAVLPFARFRALFRSRGFLLSICVLCLTMSLLTYSGSYFISVALVLLILMVTLSSRTIGYAIVGSILVFLAAVTFPEKFETYKSALTGLIDERTLELERGLEARKVYRQEFFALKYVEEEPFALLFGFGIGRYNRVLSNKFGEGAGYDEAGGIMPLNSQFYEVGFDLGVAGVLLLYAGGLVIAFRVGWGRRRNYFVSTMLLFLVIQSLFVDDKQVLVYVAALGSALIWQRGASPHRVALSPHGPLGRAISGPRRVRNLSRSPR